MKKFKYKLEGIGKNRKIRQERKKPIPYILMKPAIMNSDELTRFDPIK